jgi:RNA polymerase sigma factor (sigma-70 family)
MLHADDPAGLDRVYADHRGVVLGYLQDTFFRLLDEQDIEAALSAGITAVWRSRRTFDPRRGKLVHLFTTCARYEALTLATHRRRERRRYVPLEQVEEPFHDPLATGQLLDLQYMEFLGDVLACIKRLPPAQRAVLQADLQSGGQVDNPWLAKQLGVEVETVHSNRSRGRNRLADMLEDLGHAIPGRRRPDPDPDPAPSFDGAEPEFGT